MFSASKIASPSGGYTISRSVRLRSSASAYLTRTPASTTNRQTMTFSFWLKRGALSSAQNIYNATDNVTASSYFYFNASDVLLYTDQFNSTQLTTTQVFRDPSAWYHFVFAIDTTQATAANRVKLYVNGVQITSFSTATYPAQNSNTGFNYLSFKNDIGSYWTGSGQFFDGYMTEINFIDGQALTPSSFGQYNAYGVWSPAKYNGTYGTNGFYLNFSNNSAATAAAIGADYSGNGNNWTPNNISLTAGATYDSMIDVPTPYADGGNGRGNYCVLNPLKVVGAISQGNLATTGAGSAQYFYYGTMGVASGKWYFEAVRTASGAGIINFSVGVVKTSVGVSSATNNDYFIFNSDGTKSGAGANGTAYASSFATNDVIGTAVDLDAGTITFYKNGVSQGTAFSGISGLELTPYLPTYDTTNGVVNFGQRPFSYTPPAGFKALNTFNLPASTINNGATVMAATTYTGTGASLSVSNGNNNTTGVTFKPDLVWIKDRSQITNNGLYDSVRGTSGGFGIGLISNSTGAEVTGSGNYLTTFNSNGFTASANGSTLNDSIVAWQWQAGQGTTSSNTNGSITSTVSVNATAGFSVVTYTGTGATSATIGHGLGVAPSFVIIKQRTTAGGTLYNWNCYHIGLGSGAPQNYFIALNSTAAQTQYTSADLWSTTNPSSTVITLGSATGGGYTVNNYSGTTYVAYCWSQVAGYSKFGSYTGNGSADGPFVYCGFRPRWIMLKETNGTADNWVIRDTARDTYNASITSLYANLSNADDQPANDQIDVLSNGFKLRGTAVQMNQSGVTYIFCAFAENPFKNSLAR